MEGSRDRASPERDVAERLFGEARQLGLDDRAGYIEAACAADADLRAEVFSLLEHAEEAEAFFGRLQRHVFSSPPWAEPGGVADAAEPAAITDLPPGTMVGRYRVVERIGAGGMGTVYRAHDPVLERDIALKLLPPHLSADPEARERFLLEARAAAALDHPNICTVHEVGESEEGRLFLAMALYDGETLKARLARGPLSAVDVVACATQLARALAAAHGGGIVHRDVKPGNVMVLADGTVKLLDFGLARVADASITRPGLTPGTVAYMSPEQVRGERVDQRTDLFSLGIVLYEMLAGMRPFRGESDRAVLAAIEHGEPEPLRSLRPEMPEPIAGAVERLLRKDPEARFGKAEELLAVLGRGAGPAAEAQHAAVNGSPAVQRRARAGKLILSVLAGLAVLGFAGWLAAIGFGQGGDPGDVRRLGVLPLANLMGDPRQDYFVAGMHDALIAELSLIGGLTVVSRQSVLRYQGSDLPLRSIARELGVDALVEGSVFLAGDSVRINVQVVRAEPEEHLWAGIHTGPLRNALSLQGEVARELARAVRARVAPEVERRLAAGRPVSPEAQQAYLRGLYHLERAVYAQAVPVADRRDGHLRAIRYLEQAVALDPDWAAAHARLALAYHWLASSRGPDAAELWPRSKAAALRALELDENESQAHASLGFVLGYERNWAEAERAFRRALELDPNSHHWAYAVYLQAVGRHDEAILHYRQAEERNPLSDLLKWQVALAYSCADRLDEAIAQAEELEARMGGAERATHEGLAVGIGTRPFIAFALSRKGEHEAAIEIMEENVAMLDSVDFALTGLAYAYALAGRPDDARELAALVEARVTASGGVFRPAQIYAALGETDRALTMVEEAVAANPPNVGGFLCTHTYRLLKHEPRMQAIERRLRMPT